MFALVDCNNFYCSCEQVFQPKLRGRPLVVLSNNDGCAVARSTEAKALGVQMGEPWFQVRQRLGTQVTALSSNYALYADMSGRVMRILAHCAPQEVYSIDECFLDLSGHPGRSALGHRIKDTVMRWTGLPVSVGIASTKTLAKLANRQAKRVDHWQGVCDLSALTPAEIDRLLSGTALTDIWGIGSRLATRLEHLDIRNALELRQADTRLLRRHGSVVLERIALELRGVACLVLSDVDPDKQQIQSSRSFGTPVVSIQELTEAVTSYISRAAEKLRDQGSEAGAVYVMIRTSSFRDGEPQYSNCRVMALPEASADTRVLAAAALYGLRRIYRPGYRYAKAGVMLTALSPATTHQMGLFTDPAHHRRGQRLMAAVDHLNRQFGRDTVTLAGAGLRQRWAMRQAHRSPRYTTRWDELPVAHC